MLGTIIESKDQHFVGLDAYGVNQFTPAFWGVFCLFAYTAQKLLKSTLDVALVENWRLTDFVSPVSLVAIPNIITLGIAVIMPDLVTKESTAISANELIAEWTAIPELGFIRAALGKQLLYTVKGLRIDDRLMGVLDQILLYLTAVFLDLFSKIILGIGFLQQGIALVFLVAENVLNG